MKLIVRSLATFIPLRIQPVFQVLSAKVAENYLSIESFETFAKCTAIGVIAVTLARKAARGSWDEDFLPWVALAERLGFTKLAIALATADPVNWRQRALADSNSDQQLVACLGAGGRGWQKSFTDTVNTWFLSDIMPVLNDIKRATVRPEVLSRVNNQ